MQILPPDCSYGKAARHPPRGVCRGYRSGGRSTVRVSRVAVALIASVIAGDDRILGDDRVNLLRGGPGNDTIEGGEGDDELSGDDGDDTAQLRTASGVQVDLRAGTATGAGHDTLSGFENVTGSAKADAIFGDGNPNVLRGLYGRDDVFGRNGDDLVRGGKGGDRLDGGRGDDLVQGGTGGTS